MKQDEVKAKFLRGVQNHQLKVLLDKGVHRHIKFAAKENAWNRWFELVTWPGTLAIHGDMGSWTFSRVNDMFTFFRSPDGRINESYWAEKLEAADRTIGGTRAFSADAFRVGAIEALDDYGLADEEKNSIIKALDEEVFTGEDDESHLRRLLNDFEHGDFTFSDIWEISGHVWTYSYLRICHAIVWGDPAIRRGEGGEGIRPRNTALAGRSRMSAATYIQFPHSGLWHRAGKAVFGAGYFSACGRGPYPNIAPNVLQKTSRLKVSATLRERREAPSA